MNRSGKKVQHISFAGEELWLDAVGVLYWPAQNLLLVSDLHLEKGSFLAQFGSAIPHYDSRDTLERLRDALIHYQPDHVICLGDSFHDASALRRLGEQDAKLLHEMVASCREWVWILGNHDHAMDKAFPVTTLYNETIAEIFLTHEPDAHAPVQIIGHYHPKVRLKLGSQRVKGKCFLVNETMLVMPAFGSYTGGLDCEDPVIAALSPQAFTRYFLYRDQIWKL